MLRPEQIINAKFTPVSKGTYNAEEVDAFLKSVAASYEESLNSNQELIKKISILADKIESYRNEEDAIKLALLDAHKMAETVNKNAAEKADALVSDAENKSKIILDGANRQASQSIEEAREKAKEIVDNARTAVASLTERAQIETDNTIAEAKKKAAAIIADAEEKGREIIGTSKQSYEFYSAELEKIQAKTAEFKAAVEEICNGQLDLLVNIPVFESAPEVSVNIPVADTVAEEIAAEEPVFAEETVEPAEEKVDSAFDEIIEEINAAEEVEVPAEDEHDASAIALMAEINSLADDVLTSADESSDYAEEIAEAEEAEDIIEEIAEEEIAADDDDDLFSLIDDMDFEDVPEIDSIPASLDDLVPAAEIFNTDEDEADEAEEDEDDDEEILLVDDEDDDDEDEEFGGFQINLDAIEDENDDEDITSLFDSLFDD